MPSSPILSPPSPTSHLTLAITTPNHFLSPPLTLGWVSDILARDASYSSLPWILHPPPPPPSSLLGNLRLPAAYSSLTTLWRQHHLLETLRSWGWYPALRSHRTHLPLPSTCRMALKKNDSLQVSSHLRLCKPQERHDVFIHSCVPGFSPK